MVRPHNSPDFQKLLAAISGEISSQELWNRFAESLRPTGITRLSYINMRMDAPHDNPVVFSTMPMWWQEIYFSDKFVLDEVFFQLQPLLNVRLFNFSLSHSTPQFCARKLDRARSASDAGLRSGFTFQVSTADARRKAGWIMGGDFSEDTLKQVYTAKGTMLQLFAHYIHERLEDMECDKKEIRGSGSFLSDREQECIRHLATGSRTEGIAAHLGISVATVEFHFRNIRRKLGAATREEALAKAITCNYVTISN